MARARRRFCLVVLATLGLSASGCGTGVTPSSRATAASRDEASTRTTSHDLVRPYQTHSDYAASARRNDRERVDKSTLGARSTSPRFRSRAFARAAIGAAAHDTATRATGSRAPPAPFGLSLR